MASLKKRLAELIRRAQARGRAVSLRPAMLPGEIAKIEIQCGGALPSEIRELVQYTAGLTVDGLDISFEGRPFEFEPFPRALAIGNDGSGNFWIVDISADGSWGSVFFVAHDPPVVVNRSRDLITFLGRVLEDPTAIGIDQTVMQIARHNPGVLRRDEALASPEAIVRHFAEKIGAGFVIADLRERRPGQGFIWGLAGPNTKIERDGDQLLFAIQSKKRGLISRMFSG